MRVDYGVLIVIIGGIGGRGGEWVGKEVGFKFVFLLNFINVICFVNIIK